MEISIKDIVKAVINKWYILAAAVSLLVTIGSIISLANYNKVNYTASSSFLFSNVSSSANVNLYVGNCKAYLLTDYITYNIRQSMEDKYGEDVEYEVTIDIVSATLSIKVNSNNDLVSKSVVEEYGNQILSDENKTVSSVNELEVLPLFAPYVREYSKSITSLFLQVALFGFIGTFIGGLIILAPLYNAKMKLEKEKEKEKAEANI